MNKLKETFQILTENVKDTNIIKQITESSLQENPFFVFNIDDVIEKYEYWQKNFPQIKPYYAVKCNNHPALLKVLSTLGTGFDCASKSEIDQVLSVGVDSNRIIFANPIKFPKHLSHAAAKQVDLLTFDNEFELYKIRNLHPSARVLIRIKYDSKESYANLGKKFGCNSKTEAPSLLEVARQLNINLVGVSFHVGSGCKDVSAFHGAIKTARYVFDLAEAFGFSFDLLDIGGGFPGNSTSEMYEFSETIISSLKEFFPDDKVKVIAEPGAYFAASAFTLACCIQSVKSFKNEKYSKEDSQYMYFLNDGVYGNFAHVLSYNAIKIPIPVKKFDERKTYRSIVWGPTCDSADKIIDNILLPIMKLNDWLMFKNMGAYTMVIQTNFNSFELSVVYNFISSKNRLLLENAYFNNSRKIEHRENKLNLEEIITNLELTV